MKIIGIIVTHNRKLLLERCLYNVQKQYRKLDKILVINNGSFSNVGSWEAELVTIEYSGENREVSFTKSIVETIFCNPRVSVWETTGAAKLNKYGKFALAPNKICKWFTLFKESKLYESFDFEAEQLNLVSKNCLCMYLLTVRNFFR